jgi:hypothetical protein
MVKRPAVERLQAALIEQARLGEQYERAVGTSAELSSFSRLHTANLRVGLYQRAVDATGGPRGSSVDERRAAQ